MWFVLLLVKLYTVLTNPRIKCFNLQASNQFKIWWLGTLGKFSSKISLNVVLLVLIILSATAQNFPHFTKKKVEAQRAWEIFSNTTQMNLLLRVSF